MPAQLLVREQPATRSIVGLICCLWRLL